MARITLNETTSNDILEAVKTYTEDAEEAITDAKAKLILNMMVQKYIAIRAFPTTWTKEQIQSDVDTYFDEHCYEVANKIPMVEGRVGMEGSLSHSENGTSDTFASGDPLYGIFPDVIGFARTVGNDSEDSET